MDNLSQSQYTQLVDLIKGLRSDVDSATRVINFHKHLGYDSTSKLSSASGMPAGSDTQIQYNNSGSFGADSNLSWDNVNQVLYVGAGSLGSGAVITPKPKSGNGDYLSVGGGTSSGANGNGGDLNLVGGPPDGSGHYGYVLINSGYASALGLYSPVGGATATLDLAAANEHRITMPAGNITIALSNPTGAQKFLISITQDGGGSRSVTWFTTIKWAGGVAPTLTTTGGKRDTFGFVRTGANTYDGFVIGQNI